MADDGMVLNFATSAEPWQAKPSFKGGRWKDRLGAKKAAAYRLNKATGSQPTRVEATHGEPSADGPRPVKRARLDSGPTSFTPALRSGDPSSVRNTSRADNRSGAPKEVISSLFTYNPKSAAQDLSAEKDTTQDQDPVAPSNAPLAAELDPFTSLGLSTTLADHLLNKMNVKAPTAIQKKAVAQLIKDDSDAFLQSETGSGKTLAYLLPIVQRIITLFEKLRADKPSDAAKILSGRQSGLFAIVLAPTRELAKQISTVLESLLGCAHYIVPGIVTGGEKKKSEKARLRKGLNILVATPGRLADHLNNTEVLDVSRVRWLVLDEGDRLMELGFEQDIQRIVSVLNLRARKDVKDEDRALAELLPAQRTTVLCSATLKTDVLRLGEISLKDAAHIAVEQTRQDAADGTKLDGANGTFSAPAQLKQSYAIVPAKMRLVTLVAMLRKAFDRRGSVMKVIVFMSCADSVDFHFELLTRETAQLPSDAKRVSETQGKTSEETNGDSKPPTEIDIVRHAIRTNKPLPTYKKTPKHISQGTTITEQRTSGPGTAISSVQNPVRVHRLHGSLLQATRTSTLKQFSESTDPAVLVCTDVASRGLDLPDIDFVIEYDPPFSKDDHLHRIGRTARAGRDGRASIFLLPGSEEGYVSILNQGWSTPGRNVTRRTADEILAKGFSPVSGVVAAKSSWEAEATNFQLDVERWVLENPAHMEQARRAFQSHVRAYATHVAAERAMFDLKALHLGHLAKAFALRDKPGSIKVPGARPGADHGKKRKFTGSKQGGLKDDIEDAGAVDAREAQKKMRARMKAMGGASEFNLG